MRAMLGTFSANVTNAAFGLVTGILAARLLLPQGRGELAEVILWGATIAALAMMALPTAVAMRVAERGENPSVGTSGVILALFWSPLAVVGFLLLAPVLIENEMRPTVILYTILVVPCAIVGQTLMALDHGRKHFLRYNLAKLAPSAVYLSGILVLWASNRVSAEGFVIANLAGSFAVVLLRAPHFTTLRFAPPSTVEMFAIARLGLSMHAGALLGILFQRADQFAIIYMFGQKQLGHYAIAMTLAGFPAGLITGAMIPSFLPTIMEQKTHEGRVAHIRAMVGTAFLAAVVLCLPIALLAPFFVPFLFGSAYRDAIPITLVLSIAQIPLAYTATATIALRALGDWWTGVLGPLVGLVIFPPGLLLLAPDLGVTGIAAAMVFAWSGYMMLCAVRLRLRLQIDILRCFVPPIRTMKALAADTLKSAGLLPFRGRGS